MCVPERASPNDVVIGRNGDIFLAQGHTPGANGDPRILTTLVHELRRRGGGIGLATMCIGVGQGIATLVEVEGA